MDQINPIKKLVFACTISAAISGLRKISIKCEIDEKVQEIQIHCLGDQVMQTIQMIFANLVIKNELSILGK